MAEILTAAQRVVLARHIARPGTADFIAALFTDFFEQKGDRQNREDPSILGGIALYKGHPVTDTGRARLWRKMWPTTSVCRGRRDTARPRG